MPAEIMLVIDGSSSESRGNFSMMLGFSDELRRSFNVSSSTVHMGVVQFSAKGAGRVASSLTDDPAALSRVILSLEQSGGSTAIGEGIRMAQAELAQGRPTVKHVMILMTDGAENEGSNPLDAAYDAKSNGTEIIILGIGANTNMQHNDRPPQAHLEKSGACPTSNFGSPYYLVNAGYISGELDLHFEASSYALKDTKGNISTGGVTATGYFSLQVLDSSSGNLRGILFSYDADGPETTTITMLIGKPGVINLPLSVRAGFSDPKYDTYMLGKCNHKAPTCNFSAAMP
eukprot:gene8791-10418_t